MRERWKKAEIRLAVYSCVLLIVYLLVFVYFLVVESHGAFPSESPHGIDFGVYYTAGKMAASGHAEMAYNEPLHHAALEQLFGRKLPYFLAWVYPPMFLLAVAPFAFLPFYLSLSLWIVLTLAFAVFAVYKLVPNRKSLALVLLGFTGVNLNLRWGQNGFLNTGLIALGIYYLETSPVLAGLMFGLLCYKPQIAFFPLLILLLSKKWKVIGWTAVFASLTALLSGLVFGFDVWAAFFRSLSNTSSSLFNSGWTTYAAIEPTVFTTFCTAGFSEKTSYILQGIVSALSAAVAWCVFRHSKRLALKGSVVVLGLLLASPYFVQYDLMLLGLPVVLLCYDFLENGYRPIELVLLGMHWVMPILNEPLLLILKQHVCPFVLAAEMMLVALRVRNEREGGSSAILVKLSR